jgi:hypothetical protein
MKATNKKSKVIPIAFCLAAAVVATSALILNRMNTESVLHITQDGREIFEVDGEVIDINVNRDFILVSDDGFNEIEIKDGQIRVVNSNCPDKTCVNCGFISKHSFNKIIACIPHGLIIEFR